MLHAIITTCIGYLIVGQSDLNVFIVAAVVVDVVSAVRTIVQMWHHHFHVYVEQVKCHLHTHTHGHTHGRLYGWVYNECAPNLPVTGLKWCLMKQAYAIKPTNCTDLLKRTQFSIVHPRHLGKFPNFWLQLFPIVRPSAACALISIKWKLFLWLHSIFYGQHANWCVNGNTYVNTAVLQIWAVGKVVAATAKCNGNYPTLRQGRHLMKFDMEKC